MSRILSAFSITDTPVASQPRAIPNVVSIAGIDPSGGAGLLADLKAFSALGAYGCGVVAALTAQNTRAVTGVHLPPNDFLRLQLDTLFDDVPIAALVRPALTTLRRAGAQYRLAWEPV